MYKLHITMKFMRQCKEAHKHMYFRIHLSYQKLPRYCIPLCNPLIEVFVDMGKIDTCSYQSARGEVDALDQAKSKGSSTTASVFTFTIIN